MHQQKEKSSAKAACPTVGATVAVRHAGSKRSDAATAQLVKKAITLRQIHGPEYAAEFMQEKNIDFDIMQRVLRNVAAERRHDDLGDTIVANPSAYCA